MGAVGLNGASKDISDPAERSTIAADGWARWAPVSVVAIGAHLLGGAGLLLAQRGRVRNQPGVGANTVVKTVLTAAALGITVYSGLLGAKLAKAGNVPAEGGTVPGDATPGDVAGTQQRLRILQWATPGPHRRARRARCAARRAAAPQPADPRLAQEHQQLTGPMSCAAETAAP